MRAEQDTRRRDERGAASLAQVTITAPVLLLLLMLIVQFGLMFHARNVAEQAAQEGAAVARQFNGSASDGKADARALLAEVGTGTLRKQRVKVSRSDTRATATVSGVVVSVVPGLKLRVSESASGPVEHYVPLDGDRP